MYKIMNKIIIHIKYYHLHRLYSKLQYILVIFFIAYEQVYDVTCQQTWIWAQQSSDVSNKKIDKNVSLLQIHGNLMPILDIK